MTSRPSKLFEIAVILVLVAAVGAATRWAR